MVIVFIVGGIFGAGIFALLLERSDAKREERELEVLRLDVEMEKARALSSAIGRGYLLRG
jgi:hypothetical protein